MRQGALVLVVAVRDSLMHGSGAFWRHASPVQVRYLSCPLGLGVAKWSFEGNVTGGGNMLPAHRALQLWFSHLAPWSCAERLAFACERERAFAIESEHSEILGAPTQRRHIADVQRKLRFSLGQSTKECLTGEISTRLPKMISRILPPAVVESVPLPSYAHSRIISVCCPRMHARRTTSWKPRPARKLRGVCLNGLRKLLRDQVRRACLSPNFRNDPSQDSVRRSRTALPPFSGVARRRYRCEGLAHPPFPERPVAGYLSPEVRFFEQGRERATLGRVPPGDSGSLSTTAEYRALAYIPRVLGPVQQAVQQSFSKSEPARGGNDELKRSRRRACPVLMCASAR